MNQNPTLVKALVCDRVAELRRSAEASAPRPREQRRRPGIAAARTATGWLLIELGLRLTVSRGGVERPVVRRYA